MSSLDRRAREFKARRAIRAWEYRQRHHAKGTWYRLRRVLADARAAYLISEEAARDLIAEGYEREAVGVELEPEKTILFVPEARVAECPDARPTPVRLDADLLAAPYLALVRFDQD